MSLFSPGERGRGGVYLESPFVPPQGFSRDASDPHQELRVDFGDLRRSSPPGGPGGYGEANGDDRVGTSGRT